MAKTCQQEGCTNPVFSKGYCKWHYKRSDTTSRTKDSKAHVTYPLKRGKMSSPGRDIELRALDLAFYMSIWEEREHTCYETGKALGSEPLTLFFHHVLPKSKYPQYRHEKWNIVLLHPDVHYQVETFIDKCPKVKALTQELKEKYG